MVCFTWADDEGRSGIDTPADGLARLWRALRDPECIIIGANTAFDVHVCVYAAEEVIGSQFICDMQLFDNWMQAWDKAYSEGRVKDVLVRKRLLDLAAGRFKYHRHSDGRQTRVKHDLAGAAEETLGIRLDKSEDTWRLRYSELDGVPFDQWPKEALEYAIRDAEITGMVYEAQENWREHKLYCGIPSLWYGKLVLPDGDEPDPLQSEFYESYHALWLGTMSGHVGVMVDEFALEQYEKRMLLEYQDLVQVVRKHGMLRREYWRDLTKLRGTEWAGNARWRELKSALDVDDPEALSAWEELKADGLVRWKHCKNTSAAKQRVVDVFNLAGRDVPVTDGFDKAMKLFKRGEGPEPRREDHVALDSDTCRIGGLLEIELDMPVQKLQAYADLVHVAKAVNTDIPKIRPGIERPLHTHFTTILETGRTSSAGPPLQNRDRGRDDVAGDRECFIPTREGYVYIDIDYPQLELYCFAQCAKWIVGYSTMGDALLRGEDLHTALGGVIHGLSTYEEAVAAYEDGTLGNDRLCAKPLNFGVIGGLGANTLVVFAAKGYGVYRAADFWKDRINEFKEKWVEVKPYFKHIESSEAYEGAGEYLVPQCQSGRLRAGATYTAACNSNYQGLGADVAKLAGLYLWRASYVRGVDPVLFGSGAGLQSTQLRPGHFIHDQFLCEAREDRAAAQLPRVEYWCRKAAIEMLPDYGQAMAKKTKALIARRWSKKAKLVVDGAGKATAWEDARLFAAEDAL
jgi:hypothetical protein